MMPALEIIATVISGLQSARTILKKERVREPLSDIGVRKVMVHVLKMLRYAVMPGIIQL